MKAEICAQHVLVLTCDPRSPCVSVSQQDVEDFWLFGRELEIRIMQRWHFEAWLGEGIPFNMKASLFNFEILKEGHKLIFCSFFRIFSNTESPPDPISPFQPFPKVFSVLPEDANEWTKRFLLQYCSSKSRCHQSLCCMCGRVPCELWIQQKIILIDTKVSVFLYCMHD